MLRVAIGLEYDGAPFVGWQTQANGPSVQAAVEAAVSSVAGEPVSVHGAGRTDTGVHASGQVAHFDTSATRTARQWLLGINSNLPEAIAVTWASDVPRDFDARRSAIWREYRYTIANQPLRPALARQRVWWVREALDAGRMLAAASGWLGERDFSAFRAAHCQSRSPMRCMLRVGLEREERLLVLSFRANAFLYHMVRNMVGTLVEVGRDRIAVDAVLGLAAAGRRAEAGATAPPQGLMLVAVGYPARYGLPQQTAD